MSRSPRSSFTPTTKSSKSLRLIMQKYGYSSTSDAVNSSLNERAAHISTAVREQLEAENERRDTLEISALKREMADIRESVANITEMLNKLLGGIPK